MGKYQHTLNMDSDNSASLILRRVSPNSTVLELGPGNGYMTKYLKETLNCTVSIVEIDKEDGLQASAYADVALIGRGKGNIEKFHWKKLGSFDYIIFSDVLEHLYDPWKALKEAAKLLNENGSILISIPNISHNSVIIDLINNKFNYRELGLLDNTHIRFFTRESLTDMVVGCGLRVEQEFNTYCAVEHTEFKNSLNDVPQATSDLLEDRDDGILYQFVWELKR